MIFKRFRKKTNGSARHEEAGPSIIASDVLIEGNLSTGGELQIDGTVHGRVRAHSCVVDMQGVVEGEIVAEEVYIRGRVIGPIRGLHVHLHAGAHVEGDVINETISIENGAYIYGVIRRSEDPLADPVSSGRHGYNSPSPQSARLIPSPDDYEPRDNRPVQPLRAIRPPR